MTTDRWLSPLRYPGGKGRMVDALTELMDHQFGLLDVEIWVEPFAGGAGAGLHLLDRQIVSELWLTEKNPGLAAFWRTVTRDGHALAARVRTCTPDMSIWHHAREVIAAREHGDHVDDTELAFAALILNRCSRSGMVTANVGPIGGKNQTGRWHLLSRWNSDGIADRIDRVAALGRDIQVSEGDGIARIAELDGTVGIEEELVLLVDPPYLVQGNRLYSCGMTADDHRRLAAALNGCQARWLLTYDADDRVTDFYPDHRVLAYEIPNTAGSRQRVAEEFAVLSDNLWVHDEQTLLPKGSCRWVQHGPAGTTPQPTDEEAPQAVLSAVEQAALLRWNEVVVAGDRCEHPVSSDGLSWKVIGVTDLTDTCGHLAVELLAETPEHRVLGRQRGHVDPDAIALAPLDPLCRTDIRGRGSCPGPIAPALLDIEQLRLNALTHAPADARGRQEVMA